MSGDPPRERTSPREILTDMPIAKEGSAKPTLVTGGAGFIGSHLVDLLLQQGHRVRVLEHSGAAADHLPKGAIELVRVDIRDRQGVARAVEGCEAVYHLAADPN